jgi:hypothetical protein
MGMGLRGGRAGGGAGIDVDEVIGSDSVAAEDVIEADSSEEGVMTAIVGMSAFPASRVGSSSLTRPVSASFAGCVGRGGRDGLDRAGSAGGNVGFAAATAAGSVGVLETGGGPDEDSATNVELIAVTVSGRFGTRGTTIA